MVYKVTYLIPININYRYYVYLSKKANNKILSLRIIINVNVNLNCYDSNDVVQYYLRTISQNDFTSLTPLHVPRLEHDNIMDRKNRR